MAQAEIVNGDELYQPQEISRFAESVTRGEVDVQIATAKRYPRSIKAFKQSAMSLATLDEDTAASCFYSLPRDGKMVEGPSARLAEIVASSWGNIRAQSNIVDEDDRFIVARGVCWDLETNVAVSMDVRRRISGKSGRKYSDDMIATTANAAGSIAFRNAVFKVVPKAIWNSVYLAARKVAIGDASTLTSRRTKIIARFSQMGVSEAQLLVAVDKPSIDDIGLDELAQLIGIGTSIKEGETTVDQAFPPLTKPKEEKKPASASEALADKLKAAQTPPEAAEDTAPSVDKPKPPEPGEESQDLPPEVAAPTESELESKFNEFTTKLEQAKLSARCDELVQAFSIDGDTEWNERLIACSTARKGELRAKKPKAAGLLPDDPSGTEAYQR